MPIEPFSFFDPAYLARLEGRIAIRALVARYPRLERHRARWRDRINLRGLAELVVRAG
ncbi:MAG TPA: hypothetical protein VHW23_34305 [Kofleriaceae bacterium]|nr:hypothetical protein [Kofleriaceae bacterium]